MSTWNSQWLPRNTRARNAAAHQCAGGGKFQLFRAHDVVDLPGGAAFAARQAVTVCLDHIVDGAPLDHVGLAQEGGRETAVGVLVHLEGASHLFDEPLVHQHHAVGQGHRLGLVVRHHEGRDADAALQRAQLDLHFLAQLGVQRAHRFVEQQHRRLNHEGTRQGHALPLAAGQLARKAAGHRREMHQFERVGHPFATLGHGHAAHLQAEADVVGHGHVRKQRIALEHDAQPALAGLVVGDVAAVENDVAAGGRREACHHLQRGRLAAARRSEQAYELALRHRQAEVGYGGDVVVALVQPLEFEESHGWRCAA